jgi:hypothetical protein
MKVRLEWIDTQEELMYDSLLEQAKRDRKIREFNLHGLCEILGYCECEEVKPRKEETLDCE